MINSGDEIHMMFGNEDKMLQPETPLRRCCSVSDKVDWSDGSIYLSCINDAENCHEKDMSSFNYLSIDLRNVNPEKKDIPTQYESGKVEQFQKEAQDTTQRLFCDSSVSDAYTHTWNSDIYSRRNYLCLNTDTFNPSTTNPGISSLDNIIRFVQNGIAHFQNATNDKWTLREANFYEKTMIDLSVIVERITQFHQRGQTSVMNCNTHLLDIYRLNVESLLLNMEAFIRCSSSLQNFRNNGSIALYPEELIHSMKDVIEQSSKAVNSAWMTFLQSTTNQTDSVIQTQLSDYPVPMSSSCESFDYSTQNESYPINPNLKENMLSPNICLRKEHSNIDHQTQNHAEEKKSSPCTPCGTPSRQNQHTLIKECYVPLEKCDDSFFPARPDTIRSRKYTKLSENDTFHRKQQSKNQEFISVAPGYEDKHSENITKETPKKSIFRTRTTKADDSRQKTLLHTGDKCQHAMVGFIPSCKPLVTSIDHITPVGISSRKISQNSKLWKNSSENGAQILCASIGTQTASKTKPFSTNHTSDHHKITENEHQYKDHGSHYDELKDKRTSVSICESSNKQRRGDSILSQLSQKNKGRRNSCQRRTKLFSELNHNTNLPSKEDYSITTKDQSLISFVSSVKSYKYNPSSVHVSLQVSCVKRNVLANKLRAEESVKRSQNKKEHWLKTENLDVHRKCSPIQSYKRSSTEERCSFIPIKRIKNYLEQDAMKLKNSNNAEKDDSNSTEVEVWNRKNSTPVKSSKFQFEPVEKHSATCLIRENLKNGNARGQTLKLIEDESRFFLNQQAELTAKIKSLKKQKANIVKSSMPSTVNSTQDQVADKAKLSHKLPDLNNNLSLLM